MNDIQEMLLDQFKAAKNEDEKVRIARKFRASEAASRKYERVKQDRARDYGAIAVAYKPEAPNRIKLLRFATRSDIARIRKDVGIEGGFAFYAGVFEFENINKVWKEVSDALTKRYETDNNSYIADVDDVCQALEKRSDHVGFTIYK